MPLSAPARAGACRQARKPLRCARLGQYAQGEDHNEAVELLSRAESLAAKHLRVLLGMKTKASYSHTRASAEDAKRAGRAAAALVETARRALAE